MSHRTRTFIAVELDDDIRDRLVSLQESLARVVADVKWVERDNMHVTLLFLGEVDDRELPKVCRIVQDALTARRAFTLSVEHVGCFGNARRPRTLWVGVGDGAAELTAVHDALEIALQELGYRREERRYQPHITLGRAKSDGPSDELPAALDKRADWNAGTQEVREVLVVSSEMRKDGPIYTVLGRGKLG